MKFERDENKRKSNLSKHGLDFLDAKERIVSMRVATRKEQDRYAQEVSERNTQL